MADPIRLRTIDDVVLAFIEPNVDLGPGLERWYAAMREPGIHKTLVLTVGPVVSLPTRRRRTVSELDARGIRMVVVTDDSHNRGLVTIFSYLGVQVAMFNWASLEQAARSVAARPEQVSLIVRVAWQLRAASPAVDDS
ncbi:hypothetical protein DB30_02206 [Enhygromyxa salina]|uniref:Uncharacterized protein n=1 Tax=Enhygromyxa salina TaxID=215803 RepID=A0A0C2D460_9BACT|nr:hypothetical protein [Enhygromyxa salina]KIG17991.1 hypothetical protein DB30_02206 [Enhygromyxa salina]